MQITRGTTDNSRNEILQKIRNIKQSQSYTVIDIGGIVNGWTNEIADLVVDKNAIDSEKSMQLDICVYPEWDKLINHVLKNGKYDYAICTHTLEDVYDPFIALEMLPKIAKAGIITMPSLQAELSKVESNDWIGFIHHRWMFDVINGEMLIIPKLEFLSSIVKNLVKFNPALAEIRYEWVDEIPYQIFMNNYLGPDANTVISEYKKLINKFITKQL